MDNKIKLALLLIVLLSILTTLVWINKHTIANAEHQFSHTKDTVTLLTALRPLQSITENLIQGTHMEVLLVVPASVTLKEYGRWFKEHHKTMEFSTQARKADAVIGIASTWSADPIYPYVRLHNIRTVYIDAFESYNPVLAGIAKQRVPDSALQPIETLSQYSPYGWMSLSNAAKIAHLIAYDLQALNPKEAPLIQKNLDEYAKKIFLLKTSYEEKFLDAELSSVVAFSSDFVYLTDDFNIQVDAYLLKDAYFWDKTDFQNLSALIEQNGSKLFISRYPLNPSIMDCITKHGGYLIQLDQFDTIASDRGDYEIKDEFLGVMEENLEKMYRACTMSVRR